MLPANPTEMIMKPNRSMALIAAMAALATAGGAASTASASPRPGAASRVTVSARPSWVSRATKVAAAAPASKVELTIALKSPHAAAAAAYAASVSEPGSPDFRHFLTPAQYQSRFAPSAAAVSQVRSWLTGQGFTITHQGIGYLTVSGPASSAEAAFGTPLATFRRAGARVTAPTSAATVPATLGSVVQDVLGLDSSVTLHNNIATQSLLLSKLAATTGVTAKGISAAAAAPTASDGGCSAYWGQNQTPYLPDPPLAGSDHDNVCGYTPGQLDAARGITATGLTGKGVTAGIVVWCDDPELSSDVSQWAADVHAAPVRPGQITVDEPSQPYEDYCAAREYTPDVAPQIEVSLDAEAIHAAAPAASIVFAPATGPDDAGTLDALHRLVDADNVNIINNSWGELESDAGAADAAALDSVMEQAAAEGITVVASSGDNSDNFIDPTTGNSTPPSAEVPASDPWVTSVGGTSLGLDKASKPEFEQAWFTVATLDTSAIGSPLAGPGIFGDANGPWWPWDYQYGGGGGTSALFAQPSYQQGKVPASLAGATPMRVYPDIANVADPDTGFLMGYTDEQVTALFDMEGVGGTSVAAPFTVGQIALAIQKNHGPLGFINPLIYRSGSKDLTDLKDNTMTTGTEENFPAANLILGAPVPVDTATNAQALAAGVTTLSLAPGYDNMTGMGVPASESKFIKLLDPAS